MTIFNIPFIKENNLIPAIISFTNILKIYNLTLHEVTRTGALHTQCQNVYT